MTLGKDFSHQSIESGLKIGQTKMERVLAVLGQPRGRGRAYMGGMGLVDVWEYYFAVGDISDVKQKMLFVFFDQDSKAVAGYLWFNEF